jgi:RNA recognition motif-containing protein
MPFWQLSPYRNSLALHVPPPTFARTSPAATELDLYELFSPHGAITSCRAYSDAATGQCRGVGFVNFKHAGEACAALAALHGLQLDSGRRLHVTLQVS